MARKIDGDPILGSNPVSFVGVDGTEEVVDLAQVGNPVGGIAPEQLQKKGDVPPPTVNLGGQMFYVGDGEFSAIVPVEP